MSATIVVGPQAGTVTLNKDGSFTYKHNGSGAGEDNFVYVASNSTCDNTKEPEVSSMAPVIIKITEGGGPTLTSNVYIAGDYTVVEKCLLAFLQMKMVMVNLKLYTFQIALKPAI